MDDRMQIDESDEQEENAPDSMRESAEPGSNATLESAVPATKQFNSAVQSVMSKRKMHPVQCARVESPLRMSHLTALYSQ
jgi:hypothetical protein